MARVELVTWVANQLEEEILTGSVKPGEPLPPERQISARLGVSRSVVREAINRLSSLGLILSVHGSGNRVQPPNSQPIAMGYRRLLSQGMVNLAHIGDVRLPLETSIARLAASHRSPEHLEQLKATQVKLGDPDNTLEGHIEADMTFHMVLATATGNPLFQCVLEPIQQLVMKARRMALGKTGADLAYRHHASILAAVEAGDPARAADEMRIHMEANYKSLQTEPVVTPKREKLF
jgi:GntR family transcriptional regulator, transcriptional repressor for pyruvate dehydrogenase complex